MVESVNAALNHYFSPSVVVFLISMMPVLELRGAMVAAALQGIPWSKAILISIIGNIIPIPIVLIFIERILRWMKDHKPFTGFASWVERKGMKHGAALQSKYPKRLQLGLLLFVAIPLPGTGAWTGALIASFLGLEFTKSAPWICLGVLIAAAIMSVLTYVIPALIPHI